MKRQKKIRNIRYKDLVNLDQTIARFILPRLKLFKKKVIGYPPNITFEEWKEILDKMIVAFELIINSNEPNFGHTEFHTEKEGNLYKLVVDKSDFNAEEYQKWVNEKNAKIEEGLQLFAKYYQDLWL